MMGNGARDQRGNPARGISDWVWESLLQWIAGLDRFISFAYLSPSVYSELSVGTTG